MSNSLGNSSFVIFIWVNPGYSLMQLLKEIIVKYISYSVLTQLVKNSCVVIVEEWIYLSFGTVRECLCVPRAIQCWVDCIQVYDLIWERCLSAGILLAHYNALACRFLSILLEILCQIEQGGGMLLERSSGGPIQQTNGSSFKIVYITLDLQRIQFIAIFAKLKYE